MPKAARDMHEVVYFGNILLNGIINLMMHDAIGKVVIRFRAA
jgi:hypothetical protein